MEEDHRRVEDDGGLGGGGELRPQRLAPPRDHTLLSGLSRRAHGSPSAASHAHIASRKPSAPGIFATAAFSNAASAARALRQRCRQLLLRFLARAVVAAAAATRGLEVRGEEGRRLETVVECLAQEERAVHVGGRRLHRRLLERLALLGASATAVAPLQKS